MTSKDQQTIGSSLLSEENTDLRRMLLESLEDALSLADILGETSAAIDLSSALDKLRPNRGERNRYAGDENA